MPTNERQCREVAKLPSSQQSNTWTTAVQRAGGNKVPPARIIKQVVSEIKDEPEMKLEPKKDGIVRVSGIGIEYVAHLNEETYWMVNPEEEKLRFLK